MNIHTLKFRTTNILILINNNTNYLIIDYIHTNQTAQRPIKTLTQIRRNKQQQNNNNSILIFYMQT
jgi:hypothetical protein